MFSGDGDFYRDRSKLIYAEENGVEEEVSIDERAQRFIEKFYQRTPRFIEEEEEEEEEISIDERAQWFIENFYKELRISSSAD